MTKALVFWVLMLLWLVLGFYLFGYGANSYGPLGFNLLLFVLLAVLGWGVFGPPIRG